FSGCMSLEYFTLGKSTKSVGVDAFSDCDKIVEFKSYNSVPPTCDDQALDDINKFNCTLFVPESAIPAYENAPQWENFFQIKSINDKSIIAEWLSVDPSSWNGAENTQFQITATVLPAEAADQILVWNSSDETVASVYQNGLVTVHKEGTCIIRVQTTDGSDLLAECVITSRSGIEDIFADDAVYDVYNMSGILIMSQVTKKDIKGLEAGIYILRSGKLTIKFVLR
ncbi:MAG: Ig-like domain-containing protein, partial [Muribaculaceae bacterium]|nr:Ig-like domain-containing protein [Muribaculaceae bacterium]